MLFAMKPPPAQKKLQEELNKVKVDIEDKLVPKGGEFTRCLALPAQGKSAEWILEEMVGMDKELGVHGLEAESVIWCHLPYVPPASLFVVCDSLGGQTGVMVSPG